MKKIFLCIALAMTVGMANAQSVKQAKAKAKVEQKVTDAQTGATPVAEKKDKACQGCKDGHCKENGQCKEHGQAAMQCCKEKGQMSQDCCKDKAAKKVKGNVKKASAKGVTKKAK